MATRAFLNRQLVRLLLRMNQGSTKRTSLEQRKEGLYALLPALAAYAYGSSEMAAALFEMGQSMGFHLLPVHYYSPVPNTRQLPEETWNRRFDQIPGWTLNREAQLLLLERLSAWAPEMAGTPGDSSSPRAPGQYFWNNPNFNASDSVIYHSMIRHLNPKQIVEMGCGYSTMVAARAARLNGHTRLRCIEPFPIPELKRGIEGVEKLIEKPVQEIPVSLFEELGANDILFVDGTHVSKIGSDVNHVLFEVLTRLKPGVVVHIHDIFLPDEYPKHWIQEHRLFWNEQYLVLAFLLFNDAFEILLAGHYIGAYERAALERAYPYLPAYGGCSFWIRRKG